MRIYRTSPVLVDRSGEEAVRAWSVSYASTYHMTNDSGAFRTLAEVEGTVGGFPVGGRRYNSTSGTWVPLYEGKMIWHFDHRAASIVVNPDNQHRPAYPRESTLIELQDPNYVPAPQFWVHAADQETKLNPVVAFRDVTNPTDRRTMDAAFIPYHYAGNTLSLLLSNLGPRSTSLLLANLNAILFDYICRQKVQRII